MNIAVKLISQTTLLLLLILAFSSSSMAQEEPSDCVVLGALAFDSWISDDAGGSGFPDGEDDNDYLRCKSCHGWDHLGTSGGYVRRSRNAGRPNAGAGDSDQTSRDISFTTREGAPVTSGMVMHAGTGRSLEDGSGSWVPLADEHTAADAAAFAQGYTLGNQHPDFDEIYPDVDPVLYTIRADADAGRGEARYNDVCFACHGDPSEVGDPFPIEEDEGILEFLADTPHFSEFVHKLRWGHPDSLMTREALGNPTALDVADVALYLQQLGDTGFAMNAGLNGNWWNGLERNGEGFQVEIARNSEGDLVFVATFYSYDLMGNQIFLVAVGPVNGNTAEVDVFITDGGMYGEGLGDLGAEEQWGTGTFTADDCMNMQMVLMPNGDYQAMGYTDLMYDLVRLTSPAAICPSTS